MKLHNKKKRERGVVKLINTRLLKAKMAYNNMNIGQLADAISINRETISNVIKNVDATPSYKVIKGIYFALDLEPEELVDIFFADKIT